MRTRGSTEAEVSARVEIAKAARIALPDIGQDRLAASLGISRGQCRNYIRGRVKRFKQTPTWAHQFFRAFAAIGQSDRGTAAMELRALADLLEEGS